MPQINTMKTFRATGTIRGIPYKTLYLAMALTVPEFLYMNTAVKGIMIILLGMLALFLNIKIAEYLNRRIPENYFAHLLEWMRVGDTLYVTHDTSPIPLMVDVEAQPE